MAHTRAATRTMPTATSHTDRSHLRLWQLISPTLPIGAFAYSDGLEPAIHAQLITDRTKLEDWLRELGDETLAKVDLVYLRELYKAHTCADQALAESLADELLARRETQELRASDAHLGQALLRLLRDLDNAPEQPTRTAQSTPFAYAFACACSHWNIGPEACLEGYAWTWLENQVAAAVKLVPLGQTDGQRALLNLSDEIHQWVRVSQTLERALAGALTPGLAILSAMHETQYSRLFRS
jgi:urease accessory protein